MMLSPCTPKRPVLSSIDIMIAIGSRRRHAPSLRRVVGAQPALVLPGTKEPGEALLWTRRPDSRSRVVSHGPPQADIGVTAQVRHGRLGRDNSFYFAARRRLNLRAQNSPSRAAARESMRDVASPSPPQGLFPLVPRSPPERALRPSMASPGTSVNSPEAEMVKPRSSIIDSLGSCTKRAGSGPAGSAARRGREVELLSSPARPWRTAHVTPMLRWGGAVRIPHGER